VAKAKQRRRPLLDTRGAAEYTGFSYWQLRRWVNENSIPIPVARVRGRMYWDPDDLDRLVDSFHREIHGDPTTIEKPSPRKRSPAPRERSSAEQTRTRVK
jgi:hypothetical protein